MDTIWSWVIGPGGGE